MGSWEKTDISLKNMYIRVEQYTFSINTELCYHSGFATPSWPWPSSYVLCFDERSYTHGAWAGAKVWTWAWSIGWSCWRKLSALRHHHLSVVGTSLLANFQVLSSTTWISHHVYFCYPHHYDCHHGPLRSRWRWPQCCRPPEWPLDPSTPCNNRPGLVLMMPRHMRKMRVMDNTKMKM